MNLMYEKNNPSSVNITSSDFEVSVTNQSLILISILIPSSDDKVNLKK